DGHDIHLKYFIGRLQDLMINDVVEGANVLVEYIPIPYFGRKPIKKEGDDGFPPGCTLKLVSITLLETPPQLDIQNPTKSLRTILKPRTRHRPKQISISTTNDNCGIS